MNFRVLSNKFDTQDKGVLFGVTGYFIALVLVAINTKGTCDSGDSITHFLFSKYAFQHPELFLNHWAKPLFVLLSAPFAQFGFVGIKLFNCCIAALTIWFSYKIAKNLNYKNAWLGAVFLCFTPGYFIHIFSGLTEPLFSLVVILGVYWVLNKRFLLAICAISFLPFIRSEGLIIIAGFAFYFIVNKQYKYLPWLLLGHVVYSISGVFYYHDILWVFTKIPYSGSSGKYGSGNLSHFFVQMNYIIGIPLYVLLGLGFVKKITAVFIRKKTETYCSELCSAETLLIYGSFLDFFMAHVVFWYFGIFESMGLKRVLVSVVPLAVIVALKGYNFITISPSLPPRGGGEPTHKTNGRYSGKHLLPFGEVGRGFLAVVFAGFVIIFPFVPNPASVNWKRDLSLTADQILIADAVNSLQINSSEEKPFIYYSHPYINMLLNRDPFNPQYNKNLINISNEKRPEHYFIIWDNWFSIVENGISLEQLNADPKLKQLKAFETSDKGRAIQVVVFEGN